MIASRYLMVGLMSTALAATACGGDSKSAQPAAGGPTAAARPAVTVDKNAYPVFPNADAGADPAVAAEQGGRGFTGQGWETNTDFDLIGDPRAVKGGVLRDYMPSFPGTLRMAGPEWNTSVNYSIADMVYETLLTLHPTTLAYIPVLATHWQISPDKLTYPVPSQSQRPILGRYTRSPQTMSSRPGCF